MIEKFVLDGSIKNTVHKYITRHLSGINPYTCEPHYAHALSQFMFSALMSTQDRESIALAELIKDVQKRTVPSIRQSTLRILPESLPGRYSLQENNADSTTVLTATTE